MHSVCTQQQTRSSSERERAIARQQSASGTRGKPAQLVNTPREKRGEKKERKKKAFFFPVTAAVVPSRVIFSEAAAEDDQLYHGNSRGRGGGWGPDRDVCLPGLHEEADVRRRGQPQEAVLRGTRALRDGQHRSHEVRSCVRSGRSASASTSSFSAVPGVPPIVVVPSFLPVCFLCGSVLSLAIFFPPVVEEKLPCSWLARDHCRSTSRFRAASIGWWVAQSASTR